MTAISAFIESCVQGGQKPSLRSTLAGFSALSELALLIIGSLGAFGIFPGAAMGPAIVGLAGGSFLLVCSSNYLNPLGKIISTLALAALVTMAVLGMQGILSMRQVGFGVMGTILSPIAISLALRWLRC